MFVTVMIMRIKIIARLMLAMMTIMKMIMLMMITTLFRLNVGQKVD